MVAVVSNAQPVVVLSDDSPQQAIPRLLEIYGDRIYGLALRTCRNPSDADDIVQETFLQAFRKWDQFRGDADPGTWLYTIAVRACHRLHRRRSGEPSSMPSLDELMPFHDTRVVNIGGGASEVDPLEAYATREAIEQVEGAIVSLPWPYRLPLILKDVIELSVAQVAQATGLKEATVKTRVFRARLLLRKTVLASMPTRPAPAPEYDKQVCVDLLRAKLEAQNQGRRFPIGREVLCDRCRAVFMELDLAQDVCADLGQEDLPPALAERIAQLIERGPGKTPHRSS